MVAIPENTKTTSFIIDKHHHENQEKKPRPHMGASGIGRECEREIWYSFRWALRPDFSGRILRLFRRGHHEENWFVEDLKAIGVEILDVDPRTNDQFRYKALGGHFGGSCDGLARNVPEAPKTPHVTEFKTHNDESFADLKKKGVRESKFVHFAQMQIYMHLQGFDRALYLAVNKNDDALYSERIKYDENIASQLFSKAERIIKAKNPPPRCSENPEYYYCNHFCDFKQTCHGEKTAAMSCRTCVSSTPEFDGENGNWSCDLIATDKKNLSFDDQFAGCEKHLYLPELVPMAKPIDASEQERFIEYESNGVVFRNGKKGDGSYLSIELEHLTAPFICDAGVDTMRDTFQATFSGSTVVSENETVVDYEPKQMGAITIVGRLIIKPVGIPNGIGDLLKKYCVMNGYDKIHEGWLSTKAEAMVVAREFLSKC